jgi:uncharacterized membrane protein
MHLPHVNYLAVLVAGIVIFLLGGFWYSPALFAKKWVALMGKTEEELKPAPGTMPVKFGLAFVCGLLVAWTLAVVLNHFAPLTPWRGAALGVLCWIGFTGATSFANAIFSGKPKMLWAIDSGYNLVSFVIAGLILGAWR